ncbi:MAG: hypothetical protein K5668_10795 [Lachnospiraceae bacterium]|nr:hypothetical protein [Lachnospiraceae bacterium]
MFRLWVREWKDNHMIRDTVIEDGSDDTRTHKILHCLEEACKELDLSVPVWLDTNIEDFKRSSMTRFREDSFIDGIPFDHLEVRVIED